jgi:hypothetical protein
VGRVNNVAGADGNHFGALGCDLVVSLAQLRRVLSAEQSAEVPQEDENDRPVRPQVSEPVPVPARISQLDLFQGANVHGQGFYTTPAIPTAQVRVRRVTDTE